MTKKLISFLLAVCMLFGLAACDIIIQTGNTDTQKQSQTVSTESKKENTSSKEQTVTEKTESKKTSSDKKDYSQNNSSKTQSSAKEPKPSHKHSYSAATCTSQQKCSCGATKGEALGHKYSAATCTKAKTCKRCGNISGEALGHKYKSATCTRAKTCTRCDKTTGVALGHKYSTATCNSPKTCTRCKKTSGDKLGHNYVNNKCSRCKKVDPDSLPVSLDELTVIDASGYQNNAGNIVDSYGNSYNQSMKFYVWDDMFSKGYYEDGRSYALYNLNNKYKKFEATVAVPQQAESNSNYKICIYLDNDTKPIYTKEGFDKTTAPFKISLDVSNASKMRIEVYLEATGHEVDAIIIARQEDVLAMVNAQLTK